MSIMVVVNNPNDWPLEMPEVEVVPARQYLSNPEYSRRNGIVLFNLCRSYRYQSLGYYVSLLGAARGHRPHPSISTILDMRLVSVVRAASDDLEELIQKRLRPIQSSKFTLSIYFGRNTARRYDDLSLQLFRMFQSPFLRAEFRRDEEENYWELARIRPIGANDVPEEHRPFVVEAARAYFSRPRFQTRRRKAPRFDLAMLWDPEEEEPPSDERALRRFEKAGKRLGIEVERIEKDDFGRLAEFDALFIRETTAVNHHTFRFARSGTAEGLVVLDDPESILRCTNKVYLAELLERHKIAAPKTVVVHRDNVEQVAELIGLPCILKKPDSSFSQGVIKVGDEESLHRECRAMLEKSDLIIAQEFLPTEFDWRVGVLDRKPLFVCKYFMAPRHWQIIKNESEGGRSYGRSECVPVYQAPSKVIRTALRAAGLIGDGFYGVDLKTQGSQCYVIEINDNPSIEAGFEDAILKDDLYIQIMDVFLRRIEARKRG
jgi:glutathione synthase/RimK-type ligase-like ATP-grasp enzyme